MIGLHGCLLAQLGGGSMLAQHGCAFPHGLHGRLLVHLGGGSMLACMLACMVVACILGCMSAYNFA